MIARLVVLAAILGACIPLGQPAAYQPPDPAAVKAQQRAGLAQSMGYPSKKSPQQLEQTIETQTAKFHRAGHIRVTQLQAPEPFVFDGVDGTCYTIVMRLQDGATWGPAGDYMKFDFQRADTAGSGGPRVVGPGAVASVGCAKASGPITLTMASMVEGDPLGTGPIEMELYSHVLTRAERQRLDEDERRQIEEQREFARQEAERQARRRWSSSRRRDEQRDRERAESRSSSGSTTGGGSSSGPVSVTIRSSCGQTVPVFYGSNPKFGSGTRSSISSNSVQGRSFRAGEMMWITDASGTGLDSVTVSANTRTIEITSSCSRLAER